MPRRKPPIGAIPMFDIPEPDGRPESRGRAQLAHHRPAWKEYRPKHPKRCDDCVRHLAEHGGEGPHSRQARWKRSTAHGTRLLCLEHANRQREIDHLPELSIEPDAEPVQEESLI